MTLLFEIAPYTPPVNPDVSGMDVYQRFEREPDTMAIAVVDKADRPLGIVERNAFLVRMAAQYGHALWAKRPISAIMKPDPVIVDGDVTVEEFCDRVMGERPSELLHGLIVTCAGRYAGVGSMLSLLQASAARMAAYAAEAEAASARAKEALEARSRFLAVMSHEIRTPLNGVLAVAEIVKRKTREPELGPLLDTITNSGSVLLRLLNDALDLSRADHSGLALDEEPLSLPALLADVADLWTHQASLKGIALETSYDGPADAWVLADAVRLRQVLNNLVGNALKFARERVALRMGAREDGPCLQLEAVVLDDGPGIPPAALETIFLPFRQTDEGLRRGGAGLGLAVCHQIMRRMNGLVAVENRPAGGASFRIEAPVYRVPAPQAVIGEGLEGGASVDALHVLVVDDNATNRFVARQMMELFGCTAEDASDGAEAVAAASTGRFDLVLMDINMPGMSGLEATRRIRGLPGQAARVPILALTANADPADAALYMASGLNGVVEKPIKPERLVSAINAVLGEAEVAA